MPRVAVLVLPELSAAAKKPTVLTATAFKPVAVAESIEFALMLNRAGIEATVDWGPATRQLRVRPGSHGNAGGPQKFGTRQCRASEEAAATKDSGEAGRPVAV